MNLATGIILIALIAGVAFIINILIRDKKSGKGCSGCGGSCGGPCSGCKTSE